MVGAVLAVTLMANRTYATEGPLVRLLALAHYAYHDETSSPTGSAHGVKQSGHAALRAFGPFRDGLCGQLKIAGR